MNLKHPIKSLFANKQGLALVEFALFAPLLLIMFFSAVEFARYVIIMQKVERSAFTMSNITVQYTPITYDRKPGEIDSDVINAEVFPQFKRAMEPYIEDSDRVAIISSLSRVNDKNNNTSLKINWQIAGGGNLNSPEAVSVLNGVNASAINTAASKNGSTAGTIPSFPGFKGELMDGMLASMPVNDNMIIVETFYTYRPIVGDILNNFGATALAQRVMKSVIYSHPRSGNIPSIERTDPPPPPEPVPPPKKTYENCHWDTRSTPAYACGVYPNNTTCKTQTTCSTCTTIKICDGCTTTYTSSTDPGTKTCQMEWWNDGCTYTTTYTDTPNCPAPVPPTTIPPPPKS
jgi:hypothetical protein